MTIAVQRNREYPGEKQQLEANKKAESTYGLDGAQKKALRQEEDLHKRKMLEMEQKNFTRIYAFKTVNGWLKVMDHSAVIVSSYLDGRLGKTYKRNDDGGYGDKAKYGVVSIPPTNVGDFIERLARTGIPLTFDEEWYLEFELGERVSQEDMIQMLHEDELIIEKVNRQIMPKEKLPNLAAAVKVLLEFVHAETRNQRESTKNVFLNDVERDAVRINKLVFTTARGYLEVGTCLEQVGKFVEEMFANARTMVDLKLISARDYERMVGLILEVKNEQRRELKRIATTKAEKQMDVAVKNAKSSEEAK